MSNLGHEWCYGEAPRAQDSGVGILVNLNSFGVCVCEMRSEAFVLEMAMFTLDSRCPVRATRL